MIVYRERLGTFINQCGINGTSACVIADEVAKQMSLHGINYYDQSQYRAWYNSLPEVARALHNSRVNCDVDVAIEYKIQQSRDRIDFLICGDGADGSNNLVVVELKQWSDVTPCNKDGFVHTNGGHGVGDYWHPSYQAVNYSNILINFNEYIRKNDVQLPACAYLHNMDKGYRVTLDDSKRFPLVKAAPVFYKGDAQKLGEFIFRFIKKPNHTLLYEIENSRIVPSKLLANMLAESLKGNDFFSYDEAQATSVSQIVATVEEALYYNQKKTIIIRGGAGTGKSVVAMNVLGQLINGKKGKERRNAIYCTANASPRNLYTQQLVKGQFRKNVIKELMKYPTVFLNTAANFYDCALLDEAHRLFDFKGGVGMSKEQHILDSIIEATRVSVFFIDEDQAVTTTDYATIDIIRETARRHRSEVIEGPELELKTQFRVTGGESYISFIKSFLGYNHDVSFYLRDHYDFRVFKKASEMREAIRERDREYATASESGKCRIVAGYTYEWVSKRDDRGSNNYDIVLDGGEYKAKWNLGTGGAGYSWANDPESIDEVGCVHTCQGIDLNYCGVIIGKDMVYRDGKICWQPHMEANSDRNSGIKRAPKEIAEKLLRNTYHVLLTRGMLGTYVYCEDEALGEYLASLVHDKPAILQEKPKQTESTPVVHEVKKDKFDPTGCLTVPVYGDIAAGYGVIMNQRPDGFILTPRYDMPRYNPGKYFWLQISGDSMVDAEIYNGDYVLIRTMGNPRGDVRDGDIVAFQIYGDSATLKTLYRDGNDIILHPENKDYHDIVITEDELATGEARMIGKMMDILHYEESEERFLENDEYDDE